MTLEVCTGSVSDLMPRFRWSLALLAAVVACDDSSLSPVADASDFDLSIETDRPQYALSADSVAYVTVTNASSASVHFPMASYVVYERFAEGAWRDPFAWFIVDGIGPSFPLPPGAAHTDQLQLWFYLPGRPGTYRFRYFVYADPEVRSLLPLEERVSAHFTVTP